MFGVNYGTIQDLTIDSGTISGGLYTGGLCGRNFGSIDNVTVSNISIQSSTSSTAEYNIGGIVGRTEANSEITNVKSLNNNIINIYLGHTGGIVGLAYGRVAYSSNSSNVTSSNTSANGTGGIVGFANNGTVSQCYNEGIILGTNNVGGIVGNIGGSNQIAELCYNKGDVTNTNIAGVNGGNAGGIAGWNRGVVRNCYNVAAIEQKSVNSQTSVGGIVGIVTTSNTISNSYNIGAVIGTSTCRTGLILGFIYGSANSYSNCYAASSASTTNATKDTYNGTTTNIKEDNVLKGYASTLGSTYWKADTNNINRGFPILIWQ